MLSFLRRARMARSPSQTTRNQSADLVEKLEERRLFTATYQTALAMDPDGYVYEDITMPGVTGTWSGGDVYDQHASGSRTLNVSGLPEHAYVRVRSFYSVNVDTDWDNPDHSITVTGSMGQRTDVAQYTSAEDDGVSVEAHDSSGSLTFTIEFDGLQKEYDEWSLEEVDVDILLPTVTIQTVNGTIEEASGQQATWVVSRDYFLADDPNDSLDVTLNLPEGTATNGEDYSTMPTTLTIPAGQASSNPNDCAVTEIDDEEAEGDESILASVQPMQGLYMAFPATNKAPATTRDNPNVKSIDVLVKSTANPQETFDGFNFRVLIRFTGEALDRVQVQQQIKSHTDMWHLDGTQLTADELKAKFAGTDFNTVDSNGQFATDTDWDWKALPAVATTKFSSATLEDVQHLDLPDQEEAHGAATVRICQIVKQMHDFILKTRNGTSQAPLMSKSWGYTWDNQNCLWPASDAPRPFTYCAYNLNGLKGMFSGVYGIDGLPF